LHPEGKTGTSIDKKKYDMVKGAVIDILSEHETHLFKTLPDDVANRLGDSFDGSFGWYTTTVKLDLEARGLIERVPQQSPQQLRLAN
ncbi:MAG: hypothetical protein AAF902_22410, partial [Chloroflexota bacterium]